MSCTEAVSLKSVDCGAITSELTLNVDSTDGNKNTELDAFLLRLEIIDLKSIIHKVSHDPKGLQWSLAKAEKVAELYRQFLTLCFLYPDISSVPTEDIDTFWHYHILDTMKYQKDCRNLFGYFLHHAPNLGQHDGTENAIAFEQTRALFAEHFHVML